MKNEIIWLMLILINFSLITLVYKFFGKLGLYIWIPISVILANLQVVVTLELFGIYATLGNIIYGTGYLATDVLSEKYGKQEADKGVMIGFFSLISFTLLMWICTNFTLIDNVEHFKSMFGVMPRICVASLISYLISNKHDTWAYEIWKKKIPKYLWLRNNFSTIISQLIDTTLFTLIAFYKVLPLEVMGEIFISTFILKFVIALCDTPFIYLIKKIDKE